MQYTKHSAVSPFRQIRPVLFGVLVVTGLCLGGCSSVGRMPGDTFAGDQSDRGQSPASTSRGSFSENSSNAENASDTSRESSIAWARLPSSRPEVKVKAKSEQLFSESLAALAGSDYVTAESLLLQITKIQPELSGPWLNLGQVYLAGERNDSARMAFERAIEANPTNCAAFNQLGVLARKEGRLEEAESSYLACIDRDPTFPQVYLNLGILYEVYLGKLPLALKAYREYQDLQASSGQEDNRVKGWVVDLERRL